MIFFVLSKRQFILTHPKIIFSQSEEDLLLKIKKQTGIAHLIIDNNYPLQKNTLQKILNGNKKIDLIIKDYDIKKESLLEKIQ